MILLNGPFGVGKTTVAKLLAERTPDAVLYDPRIIGSVLQRVLRPVKKVDDGRDPALWRTLFVEVARLPRTARGESLVVPTTVRRRDDFRATTDGFLRRVDENLACFLSDSEDEGAYGWRMTHVEVCPAAARDPALGTEIRTEDRAPVEVVGEIAEKVGLKMPDRSTVINGGGTSCPR